jgi:uncharacterized phage protein (TIGR02218 family)
VSRDDWSPTFVSKLQGREIRRCYLVKMFNGITPIVRLADIDFDIIVGDETFVHSPGFTVTKFSVANGGRPAGLDFTLPFDDVGPLYSDDIKRGAWRGAVITVWLVPDFDDPSVREVLITGFVGKTGFSDRLTGQIEIITKADALADIILPTVQPECGYQLGGPYCGVDLAPFTLTATVASVTSNSKFTITVTNPDNFDFTHGKVVFTSGANDGAQDNAQLWVSGTGTVQLVTGMPFDIQVGDTLNISKGCPLSRDGCISFDNINRYPGQDYTPGELLGGN